MQATASPAMAGRQKLATHFVRTEPRQRRRRHIGLHADRHRHAAAGDGAEFLGHHQRVAVIETLPAEFDRLVEAEKAEIAELLEQLMRGEDVVLLPFVDEGIDLGGDEFLQGAAGFVVVGGEEHFSISSVIPGRCGASNPESRSVHTQLLDSGFALRAPRNDGACGAHNPICRDARSFMISSVPPPMALTLTSR